MEGDLKFGTIYAGAKPWHKLIEEAVEEANSGGREYRLIQIVPIVYSSTAYQSSLTEAVIIMEEV